MKIVLRPATEADARPLLAWRNDALTRANSRRQHELSWSELMESPPGVLGETWIGELDGRPIGSVRFDYAAGECELSWTVAPEARGAGIGHALVAAAVAAARSERLVAVIKADNPASLRIAAAAGFEKASESGGMETWRMTHRRGPS